MIEISKAALEAIDVQWPHLRGLTERYRLLTEMYEHASYDVDNQIRRRGLWRTDDIDDPELRFLRDNLKIVESEIQTTGRQIQALLHLEYESR